MFTVFEISAVGERDSWKGGIFVGTVRYFKIWLLNGLNICSYLINDCFEIWIFRTKLHKINRNNEVDLLVVIHYGM